MEINQTIGRRKSAVARIILDKGNGKITINKIDYKVYFPDRYLQLDIELPMKIVEVEGTFDIRVNVRGGGKKGQAEAVRLGIARALIKVDPEYRPPLKHALLLRRDSRVVERKKFGLKKARKASQFSKR